MEVTYKIGVIDYNGKEQSVKRLKIQRLKDIYLTINCISHIAYNKNYINSLFIWSRRLPLRTCVVVGMGATFMETKIHV